MNLINHNISNITQINTDSGRLYRTPDGNEYPSITTVLGSLNSAYLSEWKNKVGEETAANISKKAAQRGTMVHGWCENYLLGKSNIKPMTHRETWNMFENLIPFLDKFEEIHAIEQRLWSDKIKIAGTVDCIAKINKRLSVVDFKTSTRYKTKEEIDNYFLQASFYSFAFWERTGIAIQDLCILITTQDDGVIEYHENVNKWIPKLLEIRRNFTFNNNGDKM